MTFSRVEEEREIWIWKERAVSLVECNVEKEVVILIQVVYNVITSERRDLSKILVYGSYARGDYNENSDIDIMILTSLSEDKIE